MPKHKLKTDHFLIILAITLAIFLTLLLLVFFIFTSGKSQSTNTPSSSITKTAANSKYKYEYHSSELTAQFVSKDGNPKVLLTSIDLESIEMEIVRSEQRNKPTYSVIKSENNEDTFLMKEVLPNVDLEYTPLLQGVKENIVVKSLPKTPPEFTFKINSLNLSLKYFDKDGEYWFVDAKDIKKYQILPPYMTDNTGNVSYSVLYRHPQVDDPNFENNINYLEVIPDYEWLTSAERNYPVRIDPTVIKGSAPISIWNIDEGNGTTIGDNSTNGNNLTITNATWQNNDAQSSNYIGAKHVRFDGSGDYLSRTYDADFDFGTGSFSIGMWARIPNSAAGPDILLARYSGAGFKVYMDSNEYICFGIDDDSTWGPDDSACTTTAYNDSTWHHIEVVKSSTTSITLYVDGKAVATNSSTGADTTISGSSPVLYVGIDSDGSSNSFQGDIDQITVYNYARDAYQVKADALTKPQVTVSFGQSKNTLQDGLFGYWKFDENTGTSANDSSGNIHTMTLNTAAWTNGKYGPGWNGNGTRYVLLTDDADFDFAANQNFTITA